MTKEKERGGKPRVPDLDHQNRSAVIAMQSMNSSSGIVRNRGCRSIEPSSCVTGSSWNAGILRRARLTWGWLPSDDWRTKLRMPDYSAPSSPLASDA